MEEWHDVVGYEGLYQVSNLGRVKRILTSSGARAGYVLRPHIQNGYPAVHLCRGGVSKIIYVHRLVADAFLGPLMDGQEVHHKDANRIDSRLANLELLSHGDHRHKDFILGCSRVVIGQAGNGITMFD